MRNAILVSAILLVGTSPLAADQAIPNPPATTKLGALRSSKPPDPYGKLFQARAALTQAVDQQTAKTAPKAKVVCGMMIVEADPSLDPKMAVTPPQDQTLSYAIRVFESPICK